MGGRERPLVLALGHPARRDAAGGSRSRRRDPGGRRGSRAERALPGGTETFPLGVAEVSPGDPALDRALDLVSRRFHVPVPAAPTGVRLYTVQLLAAAQPSHAAAFVQSLDTRVPASEPDFFWEACAPCYPQIAHVLEDGNGARRVVVGMYADRAAAHRAASELRARGLPAHVRVL